MTIELKDRPNVVILLMDCVRSSDFPPPPLEGPSASGFEDLLDEMVSYPRAATVSPWTIPSHASLFTGLYPWVHGVHHKGRRRLPSELPRISTLLRSQGYQTLALSGNAFLTPSSGLVDGFDTVGWCRWIDPYLRTSRRRPPAFFGSYFEGVRREQEYRRSKFVNGVKSYAASGILEFPFVVDAINRLLVHIQGRGDGYRVSPWIESSYDQWIRGCSADRPILTFLNLIDAHDPYLTDPNLIHSLSEWWSFARLNQQPGAYYLGRWKPSIAQRNALHDLYVRSIQTACSRVLNVVSILKQQGRWENTLFILTSDHGNAFGEDGLFFHGLRVTEPVARIPLWVRFPHAERAGSKAAGWASLIDILPTVVEETASPDRPRTPGIGLRQLIDQERTGPVLVASDGVQATIRKRNLISEEVVRRLDRVWVAAYEGDRKVVYDASSGALTAFTLEPRRGPVYDAWRTEADGVSDLARSARSVAQAMMHSTAPTPDERLASWGYT